MSLEISTYRFYTTVSIYALASNEETHIKLPISWHMTACRVVHRYVRFGRTYCFHLHGISHFSTINIEKAGSPKRRYMTIISDIWGSYNAEYQDYGRVRYDAV
jgi:hypothetical protein